MRINIRFCDYFIGFVSSNDLESRILLIDLVFKNMNITLDKRVPCPLQHLNFIKGYKIILQIKNLFISQIVSPYLCFGSLFIFF